MFYQDPERLQAVNRFLDLDINRKEELQEMVELAAALCYTPIAMITLMDDQTEYVKFGVGTDMKNQLREDTFCQYVVEGNDLLVITDASRDPRSAKNALVTGEPKVRFYAGCPLITHDGHNVGSLCVLGLIIKQLTEAQKHLLHVLAKRVVEIMELEFSLKILKRQFLMAKDSDVKLRSFYESADTSHLPLNKELAVIAYSLLKIAHIQSQEMRSPVASILGLMEIFRSSDYSSTKEELMMLGKAASDLDIKIRAMVALTE